MRTLLTIFFCSVILCLNAQNTILIPRDAADLSAAVQMANSGDTILLSSGIYLDSVFVHNKQLVIQGQPDGSSVLSSGANGRSFHLLNSNVQFIHLTFDDFQQNTVAPNYAIHATYSDVSIDQCLFNRLISPVYLSWGHLEISRSTFSDGRGASSLLMVGGSFEIHNNLFYGQNQSGVIITNANGKFFNNTVVGTPSINHYALLINPDSTTHIFNNIFNGFVRGIYLVASDSNQYNSLKVYNNNLHQVANPYRYEYNESLSLPVFYGSYSPNPGTGEMNVPPNFVDTTNRNYNLKSGSLCIDAGTSAFPRVITSDLNGNNRIFGRNPDLGAYEFSPLTSINNQPFNSNEIDMVVSPQPAKDYAFIRVKEKIEGRLELLSPSGKLINQIRIKGSNEIRIVLPAARGLYLLRFIANNESVIVKKVLKV